LPAGDGWIDFWTGQTYRGGQTTTVKAPLNEIPILVKAGSILPLGPVVQNASEPQEDLEIRIYPGKDVAYDLYEDAGDGYAYERGAHAITHLQWNDRQKLLSIADRKGSFPGISPARKLRIVMVKPGHGAGDRPGSSFDRTIDYSGHAMKIDLKKVN
jgi:alpha-D-xyloside xylohydrolase